MDFKFPIISADSHITEHPETYLNHIDPAFRDRAPHIRRDPQLGDLFVAEGMKPIKLGLVAAAGQRPEEIKPGGLFEDMHRSGWDPAGRLGDQARDGVSAEILYPTVGMMLCNLPDLAYKSACFRAYNRWIQEYCAFAPSRLLGVGQTAARSPREAVEDLVTIKEMGLKGIMMPGVPGEADYDDPQWDLFWSAAAEMQMPVSFHILTTPSERTRGSKLTQFLAIVRGVQDVLALLVFGGVFDRHPTLKVVCVEADAGWVPHFTYRMDHAYKRHRHHMAPGEDLERLPSEYFFENLYVTFQDDWTAFKQANELNWKRLMWANDFPHSDSTWPWSQEMLREHTGCLTEQQQQAILGGNCAALYDIDTSLLPVHSEVAA